MAEKSTRRASLSSCTDRRGWTAAAPKPADPDWGPPPGDPRPTQGVRWGPGLSSVREGCHNLTWEHSLKDGDFTQIHLFVPFKGIQIGAEEMEDRPTYYLF